jgi:glycosyltransferase involved in cell wall biosynthesis
MDFPRNGGHWDCSVWEHGLSLYSAELAADGASLGQTRRISPARPSCIVSETDGPRELVSRYKCGVVVDAADEIAAAARTILRRYKRFSENALLCFNERLRF